MRTIVTISSVLAATVIALGVSPDSEAFAHSRDHGTISASPLATLTADVTNLTVYGPTSHGVRVDVAFRGELNGRLKGTMEGIDYGTIRGDGVTDINVRGKILTNDQALIAVEITGAMFNGQVTDTQVKFVTAAPQYAWLADRMIVGKGTATTEKLAIRYFILD